jgi:hypothetical protein
LPEKGGKTTLTLQLLKINDLKLISEDSPLLSREGKILPFPLRIGILPGGESDIPSEYQRSVKFKRVGIKVLIDIDYFKDRISNIAEPGIILIGERVLGCKSEIKAAGKLKALNELIKNSVVGLGLAQGLEYILGRDLRLVLANSRLAYSRFINCQKILHRSRVYRFIIGHNTKDNIKTLVKFLDDVSAAQ